MEAKRESYHVGLILFYVTWSMYKLEYQKRLCFEMTISTTRSISLPTKVSVTKRMSLNIKYD